MKRFLSLSAVLVALASLSLSASATPLMPGSASSTTPDQLNYSGLNLLAYTPPQTMNPGTFTATYQMGVASDSNNVYCSGCLDFIYLVQNSGSTGIIESISASSFTGSLTSVGYFASGSSSVAPSGDSRSADGSVVKFYFGTSGLTTGQTADYLVIETNAKNYTTGSWSVQDGSAFTAAGYAPTNVTPEPSTLMLLGTGLFGAAGVVRRRIGSVVRG